MPVAVQVVAFFTLVVVQSTAILLFKLAQVNDEFAFSASSNVALTELVKLFLALSFHGLDVSRDHAELVPEVSPSMVLHYFGLSALYTSNNILTFYVLELADPGTLSLFKSVAPYLCAIFLRFTGQRINRLQWCCVIVQCCSIGIIQYDVVKGMGIVPLKGYTLLALATTITATSSVWNQQVIKGFAVPVNVQNAILYIFGFTMSVVVYLTSAKKDPSKGFFDGYTWLAWLLVFFQALHGLAVSFVYKYADAIVKNFANSSVMAVLVFVSAMLFGVEMNVHSALAVIIVIVTTYVYMAIAVNMPADKPRIIEKSTEIGETLALVNSPSGKV